MLEKLPTLDSLEFSKENCTEFNRIPCCNFLLKKVWQTFLSLWLKKFFLMLHFFWCSENSQWSKTSVNEKEGKMWLYIHFTLCFDCSFVTGLLIYPQRIRGDVQEPAVLLVTVIIQDSPDISEEEHTLSPFRLSEILLAS